MNDEGLRALELPEAGGWTNQRIVELSSVQLADRRGAARRGRELGQFDRAVAGV